MNNIITSVMRVIMEVGQCSFIFTSDYITQLNLYWKRKEPKAISTVYTIKARHSAQLKKLLFRAGRC